LHGFPEFWYGWRHQIPAFADAGYRVVVPDQRGYNRSDKPDSIDAYTTDEVAADAVGLLDALGHDRARFVGHDWGAAVLWHVLLAHPERVERAATMNVPHPAVFQEFLSSQPSQLLKSWYMFFFQLPRVPEVAFSAVDWRGLRWFMDTSNREDTFTREDVRRYVEAWSRPGAFTGMLNWYRAVFRADGADPPTMTVEPETMLVWGTGDAYLNREMAPESMSYCEDGRLELVEDATHWVQHERPDLVNDLLVAFLD
jgi:pimeloyl-ACP methyl ester carboxylesterase